MHFGILGPLRVDDGTAEVVVSAPRQRALLALLLINANEGLSPDRILDEVWGDEVPASGAKALQFHISKLRGLIGGEEHLVTEAPGYALKVARNELDVYEFEDLVDRGRSRLDDDPKSAREVLVNALALWRGSALADFAYDDFARTEIARLEELRRTVESDRIDADLASGLHRQVIGELEESVVAHPFDERMHGQLMTALYRSGRQADALRTYTRLRTALGEELGIEPSTATQDLEDQILLQAPELRPPPDLEPANTLPHFLTEFIGRNEELGQVDRLLEENRLVTLIGLGGIGKTRIAIAAAERTGGARRHGTALVDLAPVSDPLAVAQAFAEGLGIDSTPNTSSEEALLRHLATKDMLLIVDNCEHLLENVAALVHKILESARSTSLLATSREPLGVSGEMVYRVPALSISPAAEEAIPDALQLFIDRAHLRRPGLIFDDEAMTVGGRICEQLEGIPLAIELAAARLRALSLQELEERLGDRFALLTGGDRTAAQRHRTLEATLDWSYDHLDEREQQLLRACATFRGGFDFDAAEALAGDLWSGRPLDAITHLLDTSLVGMRPGHPVRYTLLETIRDYARDKLIAAGEWEPVHRKHAEYFSRMVEQCSAMAQGSDHEAAYSRLMADEANIQSALDWSLSHDEPLALSIAAGMGDFWVNAGNHDLAHRNLAAAVGLDAEAAPEKTLMALRHLTLLAVWEGRTSEADELIDRQRSIAATTGDQVALARSLASQATVAWSRGQNRRARELLIQALEEVDRDPTTDEVSWTARVSFHSSWMGDVATAERYADQLEELRRDIETPMLDAYAADARGTILLQTGDLEGALALFETARGIYERLGVDLNVEDMLQSEAGILVDLDRIEEAEQLVARAMHISEALNDKRIGARSVLLEGRIATHKSEFERAEQHMAAAVRMSHRADDRAGVLLAVLASATLASAQQNHQECLRLHGIAESIRVGIDVETPAEQQRREAEEIGIARQAIGRARADGIWSEGLASGYAGAVALTESLPRASSVSPSRSSIA